jgi:hypothetical protein
MALLTACGEGDEDVATDLGPAELLLGTGETTFAELRDNDAPPITQGPQNGYHLWVSLRVKGFELPDARIRILGFADGVALSDSGYGRTFAEVGAPAGAPPSEKWGELVGLAAFLDFTRLGSSSGGPVCQDPALGLGKTFELRVTVTDRKGRTVAKTVSVRPTCVHSILMTSCAPQPCTLFCPDSCIRCDTNGVLNDYCP